MRMIAGWAAFLAIIPLTVAVHVSAQTTAPAKKTSPKKAASKSRTGSKKTASSKTASSKKGKKSSKKSATTWRNRQLSPSAERYREIQSALAAKGYLQPGDATGTWNDASAAALKKFQTDQNIEATGKVNSLSLIALGLGPKYEAKSVPPPPAGAAPPAASSPTPAQ